VRTDSVCHALNGYTRIINYLKEGYCFQFKFDSEVIVFLRIKIIIAEKTAIAKAI